MLTTAILLVLLAVATVTDWRERKIYNWLTYPGILLALALNAGTTLWERYGVQSGGPPDWLGAVGLNESLLGLAACGAVMLVCYVFFAGGVGGGDIKLIALIGAWLGPFQGLEAMLWTFVLGGAVALVHLVWQVGGPLKLTRRVAGYLLLVARYRTVAPLSEEQRQPLKTQLFLAPAAMAAVVIVQFKLIEGWL